MKILKWADTMTTKKVFGSHETCNTDQSFALHNCSLADPGFGQGGPQNFFRDFVDVTKWSQVSEASQYWPGNRARLRGSPGSSCIFNPHICILPLFLVLFLQNILWTFVWVNYKISISIWKILNILVNAISFSLSETIKGLICSFTFAWRYITL